MLIIRKQRIGGFMMNMSFKTVCTIERMSLLTHADLVSSLGDHTTVLRLQAINWCNVLICLGCFPTLDSLTSRGQEQPLESKCMDVLENIRKHQSLIINSVCSTLLPSCRFILCLSLLVLNIFAWFLSHPLLCKTSQKLYKHMRGKCL